MDESPVQRVRRRKGRRSNIFNLSDVFTPLDNTDYSEIENSRAPDSPTQVNEPNQRTATPVEMLEMNEESSPLITQEIRMPISTDFCINSDTDKDSIIHVNPVKDTNGILDLSAPYSPSQPVFNYDSPLVVSPLASGKTSVYNTPVSSGLTLKSEDKVDEVLKSSKSEKTKSRGKSQTNSTSARKSGRKKKPQNQNDESNKTAGFLSICRSLAGKLATFVKPNFVSTEQSDECESVTVSASSSGTSVKSLCSEPVISPESDFVYLETESSDTGDKYVNIKIQENSDIDCNQKEVTSLEPEKKENVRVRKTRAKSLKEQKENKVKCEQVSKNKPSEAEVVINADIQKTEINSGVIADPGTNTGTDDSDQKVNFYLNDELNDDQNKFYLETVQESVNCEEIEQSASSQEQQESAMYTQLEKQRIFNELDQYLGEQQDEKENIEIEPKTKRRCRKSVEVFTACDLDENKYLNDENSKESSVQTAGRRSTRLRRKSFEMCLKNVTKIVQDEENKEQFTNSPTASPVTVNEGGDDSTESSSDSVQKVKYIKYSRKRKLGEKELSLEEIYRNKNYKQPEEKKWETIFESPMKSKNPNILQSRLRYKRAVDFEIVPPAKLKKRVQKALKLGWDQRKRKKSSLTDDYVLQKLDEMDEILKS